MEAITLNEVRHFLNNNPLHLRSTHHKVCFHILQRIHTKLANGQRFAPIKTAGDIIIDGHHRYICLSMLNIEIEAVPYTRNSSTIIYDWKDVQIDPNEWETPEQIRSHNWN